MTIRAIVLATAMGFVATLGASAAESAFWNTGETGAAGVKKAIDFTIHGGELWALANDVSGSTAIDRVYKGAYDAGTKSCTWTLECTITTTGLCAPTTYLPEPAAYQNPPLAIRSYLGGIDGHALWPQLVSGPGGLYTTRRYGVVLKKTNPNTTICMLEYAVIEVSGANPANPGKEVPVLQNRSASIGGYHNTVYNVAALVNGYLFNTGGTLYWAGGGGKQIPVDNRYTQGVGYEEGANTFQYMYSSANGINWSLLNRTLGNNEYGQALPAAMPDGYRYNHIIEFDGKMWDYYGYYDIGGTFAFHPKLDDVHTEPWGWHLMGKYTKTGASDPARLARVGFNKKGDTTYLYEITGTGGTWAPMATEGRVALEPSAAASWTLAQGANVIVDDSMQVFANDPAAGQDIELRRGVDYTCSAAGAVNITSAPAGANAFKATYLYRTTTSLAPNDGTVYWRSCAGAVNTVRTVSEDIGVANGTLRRFDLSKNAHVSNVAVTVAGAPKTAGVDFYATPSGRVIFFAAPAAGTVRATYQCMSPHDGLYCTYSKDNGGGAYESGVYKYGDDDYDWLWSFKQCVSTPDARVYTGAIATKPDQSVVVGTSTGVVRRRIDSDPAVDPVP